METSAKEIIDKIKKSLEYSDCSKVDVSDLTVFEFNKLIESLAKEDLIFSIERMNYRTYLEVCKKKHELALI